MIWGALIAAGVGCYLIKLAGLSLPSTVLGHPLVARVAGLLPVALLAALVATGTLADGRAVVVDARLVGLAAAVVALLLRASFLVVVVVAAIATALTRIAYA